MLRRSLFALAAAGAALGLLSCSGSSTPPPPPADNGTTYKPLKGDEVEHLKIVLSSVFPRGWEIVAIYSATPPEEKYLKKYLVKVYSPLDHAVYNRYVWLTNDGKVLFTYGYLVRGSGAYPIIPKEAKEYPLENVGWILDIERIAIEGNLPLTLTGGKRTVYLVWNPYCKECFEKWKEILETAKREHLSVKLIPYHNVYYPLDNLYALIYLLYRAQNEGLLTVLNSYYSSAKSFEDFLQRVKRDTYAHLGEIPKDTFNRLGYYLKQIYTVLGQAKVYVVPTTVWVVDINPQLGMAKGYVYVGRIELFPPEVKNKGENPEGR